LAEKNKNPPIGIMRREIWREKAVQDRVQGILEAMKRYAESKIPIPIEWVEELREHLGIE